MAIQTIEFRSPPSQTITAKLFAVGSDTEVASVSTTEATNRKGTYSAAYTDVAAGEYELIALVSTTPVARWFVTLTSTTATFQVYDKVQTVLMSADAVAEIQSGLATAANLLIVNDGVGYLTAMFMGTISNAGTPTETYVQIFGAATYTVAFTGLDSTGNRRGVTRTKT